MKIERYRQIVNDLRAEISSGKYNIGDVFPIRSELARRFNTTRSTVNRAIEILINDGLLTAQRGSGTIVQALNTRLKIAYVAPEWLMRHMPRSKVCELFYIPYNKAVNSKKALQGLKNYDGIIWSHPSEKDFLTIKHISMEIPSIIVNRFIDEVDCVSSEYVNSFSKYVNERLSEHPGVTPYFLSSSQSKDSTPFSQRFEGFIKACREHKRFYERIELPVDFRCKQAIFNERIDADKEELLVFSDNWSHTGAFIFWAQQQGKIFGKNVFYIDFDNTEPEHVWGLTTTSIVQNFDYLTETALQRLLALINTPKDPQKILLAPDLRPGNT